MHLSDVSRHDDAELLERHALARPGEAEDVELERFRAAHPALIRVTDSVLALLRGRLQGNPYETEQWLTAVKGRGERPRTTQRVSPFPGRTWTAGASRGRVWARRSTGYVLVGLAAVVLLVAGVLTGWPSFRANRPVSMATYVTGNGQRARITLDDGSTVALGVASRLEVPSDYAAGDRTVRLSGEAIFTVNHHGRAPFTVVTDGATTHVLGTSFLVRRYVTDGATLVAVRDGKVAVRSAHVHPMVVAARQQLSVSPSWATALQPMDPALFTFASGTLTLDGMALRDAVVELDRWYDADIRLGDPALADRHVKGEFASGSLSDLSNLLTLTFGVRVVREGRVLTLYPR